MVENNSIIPYQKNGLLPRVTNSLEITKKLLAKDDEKLIPYRKGKKWGFANEDRKIQIDCVYDQVGMFKNGNSVVFQDHKYFCIDKKGFHIKQLDNFISNNIEYYLPECVSQLGNCFNFNGVFSSSGIIRNFKEGLAPRIRGKKLGYINIKGELVIPEIYESDIFSQFSKFSEGLISVKKDGKWGYIDRNGNTYISFSYDVAENFKNGVAEVVKDGLWGVIDINEKAIKPFYYEVEEYDFFGIISHNFSDGIKSVKKFNKWGYINEKWELVIKNQYDFAESFKYAIAAVSKEGKWGFIDKNNKTIIPFVYQELKNDGNELISAKKNGKWGCINRQGNIIIPFNYEESINFKNGLAVVKQNGKMGIINETGKIIISLEFDKIVDDDYEKKTADKELMPVKVDGKFGFINFKGKICVPCIYDAVGFFHSGLSAVCYNDKCGYINKKGETIIPFKYNEAYNFDGNIALIKNNSKTYGLINFKGIEFWED